MGWRSRRRALYLGVALLGLALGGCRLHLDAIHTGGLWTPEDYAELALGRDDRGEVLERMGPPDEVRYTLEDEVFVYRRGRHRGSDLRLLLPDTLLDQARPGLEILGPDAQAPEEFGGQAALVGVLRGAMETLLGFAVPASADDALSLVRRRLRWDVARLVLDRETGLLRSKELLLDTGDQGAENAAD